jgi:thiol-disulfide isomerase/thioredoxin
MTNVFDPEFLKSKFASGVPFEQYVASGKTHEQANWHAFSERVSLTAAQNELVAGFTRHLNVLCLSGTWCGDCVQQVPFLSHIEKANPEHITLRILDRDASPDLAVPLKICGGSRVPVTLWLNEDFDFLGHMGDRTLSRYRVLAAKQLGGACPLPGAPVPPDEIATQLAEYVGEFERAQLMLRLSTKMRQRYGD